MELTQWDSIYDVYKRSLVKLIYNIVNWIECSVKC